MPSYKIIYFPVRGRAEHLRLMFVYANVPFEDCRIAKEDWEKIKPSKGSSRFVLTDLLGSVVPLALLTLH